LFLDNATEWDSWFGKRGMEQQQCEEAAMPVARHIFGRDKPSLTALAHSGAAPGERRRALALQQLFQPPPAHEELGAGAHVARGGDKAIWWTAPSRVLTALLGRPRR
jgi:hypothetical protein